MTYPTHEDAEQRRSSSRLTVALALAFVMILVLNVLGVLLQARTRPAEVLIYRQDAGTSARLTDCTSPAGACYQQQLAVNIYIAQCAKTTNTDDELSACIADRLRAAGLPVPPIVASGAAAAGPSPTPSIAQDDD